jgi:hypothetical protein
MNKDLIILALTSGEQGPYPLDPIRIMKAAFLVSQLGPADLKSQFTFKPYDYGPFDPSVYETISTLKKNDLLNEINADGSKYPSYSITDAGIETLQDMSTKQKEIDWLKSISEYVTSKSFTDLLTAIYAKFPAYAEKSVFKK